MQKVGDQVLQKIQDLLVEIDGPKRRRLKLINPTYSELAEYERQDRLFKHQKNQEIKNKEKQRNRVYTQLQQLQPFKVTNKHSIFLNNQNYQRPLHERFKEIAFQKERYLLEKRMQKSKMQQKLQQQEEEQILKIQASRNKSKFTQKQFKEHVRELDLKNIERINRMNMRKVQKLRQTAQQVSGKPQLNKSTLNIWEQTKLKKSISSNLLKRFEQYQWDKKKKNQEYIKARHQLETPFQPMISVTSRIIAENLSRSPLDRSISRSTSCKCLKKKQENHKKSISTYANSQKNYMNQENKYNQSGKSHREDKTKSHKKTPNKTINRSATNAFQLRFD